jgi:hypothetical protein
VLRLTLLIPDIIEAIINGRQPAVFAVGRSDEANFHDVERTGRSNAGMGTDPAFQ